MRLSSEIKKIIKNSDLSYRGIIKYVDNRFKVKVSKSTISYYRRSKDRLNNLNTDNLDQKDLDWLNGFFVADGCKYIERKYEYVVKFALDKKTDKKTLRKLSGILEKLGCRFSIRNETNITIVRIYSKKLFNILPVKNTSFIPENPSSFLAGLIDGDGYKKKNSAVLVQYGNLDMMNHLSKLFGLRRSEFAVITNYGQSIRRQYYIPKHVCDSIRKQSTKLNM